MAGGFAADEPSHFRCALQRRREQKNGGGERGRGAIYWGRRGARNHRVIDNREVRRNENRPLIVEIESDSRIGEMEELASCKE